MKKKVINTDRFVTGFNGTDCVLRSKMVNHITGNRIVGGSVFLYKKEFKTWMSAFGFHFWNEDREGNIWDSESMWMNFPHHNFTSTNYRKIDGSKFRWLKTRSATLDDEKYQGIIKHLNKVFPKGKGCDIVYVEGFGYDHNWNLQGRDWFMGLMEQFEKEHLIFN